MVSHIKLYGLRGIKSAIKIKGINRLQKSVRLRVTSHTRSNGIRSIMVHLESKINLVG